MFLVVLHDIVAEGVHRDDLGRIPPCLLGRKVECRLCICKIRLEVHGEVAGGDGKGAVEGVATAVGADGVASVEGFTIAGDKDRAAFLRVFFAPF